MRDARSLYGEYTEQHLICHCLGSCPIRIQLLGINALLDVWRSSVCVQRGERGRGKREVSRDESSEKPSGKITVVPPPRSILLSTYLHSYQQTHTLDFCTDSYGIQVTSTETNHLTSVSALMTRTDQKKMALQAWSKAESETHCFVPRHIWMCDFQWVDGETVSQWLVLS